MSATLHVLTPPHGGSIEVERTPARHPSGRTPLVLVPGIGGPRGAFHHVVRAFAEDRDVVATSLNPSRAQGLGAIASAAGDVLHVLDHLGLECVDLLGASFGSCVVAQVAETVPERLRRQVWVAPPVVRHAPWRTLFGPGWLFGGAAMKFAPERYRRDVVRALAEHRIYSPEPDLSVEELVLLAGRASDTELGPFFHRLGDLHEWNWRERPRPVARPLLVVQGDQESPLTPPDIHETWETLSGRPIAFTPGRHMPYLSYPQPFIDQTKRFLDASADGGSYS